MKVKLNFHKDAIAGFFAHQSEKIVLGVVALCLLMFVYRAIGRERYDKTPDDLIRAAQDAEKKIEGTQPAAASDGSQYEDWVARNNVAIELTPYRPGAVWNPLIFELRRKRGEPKLYAVQGLRGAAGVGAATVTGESRDGQRPSTGSGRDRRGVHWIVLTGAVPFAEQSGAYEECFKDAMKAGAASGRSSDTPNYVYYQVQRAKVNPLADSAELQWETLNLKAAKSAAEKAWRMQTSEVVPAPYIDASNRALVFPLPPLIDHTWDASVAHEPEIPLSRRDADREEVKEPSAAEPSRQPEGPVSDVPTTEGMGGPGTERQGRDVAGPDTGDATRPARSGGVPGRGAVAEVPHRLFRFFDFNVEPGATYRYRVQLWLANPNYGLESRLVQSSALAEQAWIKTEWTEPTGLIRVPRDDRLLTVSVLPSRGVAGEPSSKVLAVHWDMDLGAESREEFSVFRGTLANFLDRTGQTNVRSSMLGSLDRRRISGGRDGGEPHKVDYKTDALVLDLRGGERLPGRDREQTRPGELLLLTAEGTLAVEGELEAAAEVKEKNAPSGGLKRPAGKSAAR